MMHRFHVLFKTPDVEVRVFGRLNTNPFTILGYGFEVIHLDGNSNLLVIKTISDAASHISLKQFQHPRLVP